MPQSVRPVGTFAFAECRQLECADLRAAHGLKELETCIFIACGKLKHLLLNDSLEKLSEKEIFYRGEYKGNVFALSTIESIELSCALRKI